MCFLFIFMICCCKKPSVTAYKAAVLEYYPIISDTPKSTILWNLHEYEKYASKAKTQDADIIVFPEYGLTTLVNNTRQYSVEVNPFSDVITRLKAIASENRIYLVVNLLEKVHQYCCGTAEYYNTNLVFDRNGSLVAQYRKINLFKEKGLRPGELNQTVTFSTDFGATFGVFTSSDILFAKPSRDVLKGGDVTDVVYPTAWSSIGPFYTALSIQHGYSMSNGVNLLASGYNQPLQRLSGTGIYLSDGKIAEAYYTDSPGNKLIVHEVPKLAKPNKTCSLSNQTQVATSIVYPLPKDFHSSIYKFKNVDLRKKNMSTTVCDGKFCCFFKILGNQTHFFYKVMAFDGFIFHDRSKLHVNLCSLLSCENDSHDSCGSRIDSVTNLTKITVRGNTNGDMFYAPVTLNFDFQPLTQFVYCDMRTVANASFVELRTVDNQENVLAFGILGLGDSASSLGQGYFFVFLSILCLIF